ncbi:flagellin [Rhizobium sp. 'Codium 1']|uniref:flagellin N-terminal helical domain-containing protein n=1 Tax=Rhizobium sp. 'Codium 1' TaxID=2940484 RepID=UPI001E59BF99|nr:flagellin [Rhizobium sp. 'Codium 1']MCC8931077.1 flagellin [Rhizobium sp. 'Codium 1']
MPSLLTNTAAISALANLRQISHELGINQRQVSSGLRVQQASDDAAYWSIGTTMRSDNQALAAVEDALGLGAAAVDTAYAGMSSAIEVVQEIKAKLVTAREESVDKLKINEELDQLKEQIYSIVESASFSGQNWLHRIDAADDADKQIVGSFTRSGNSVSLQNLSYGMSNQWGTNHLIDENYHNGILTNVEFARDLGTATEWVLLSGKNHDIHEDMILTADTSAQDIDEMVSVLEMMLGAMADAGAKLGAISQRIEMQTEFVQVLQDAVDRGIGRLVDADLQEAATRSKALEVQQQLATQSLSIANSEPDILLRLFQ